MSILVARAEWHARLVRMSKSTNPIATLSVIIILGPPLMVAAMLWPAFVAHDIWSDMVLRFGWRPVSIAEFAIASLVFGLMRPNLLLTDRESRTRDIAILAILPVITWLLANAVLFLV